MEHTDKNRAESKNRTQEGNTGNSQSESADSIHAGSAGKSPNKTSGRVHTGSAGNSPNETSDRVHTGSAGKSPNESAGSIHTGSAGNSQRRNPDSIQITGNPQTEIADGPRNRQKPGVQTAGPLPFSSPHPASIRTRWGEKPYYSLDFYLKETFGRKVYKLALDGGMTCPNRDGTLGTGGCIFCSEGGSGDFSQQTAGDFSRSGIHAQIERAKERVALKIKDGKYIAYFQSFTNTYAPVSYLERLFSGALSHPDVIALSVGTRPDCLPPETVKLLKKLNQVKPVWVELGLQTIHARTARLIRRGYELPCFLDAFRRLKEAGLTVIVHVILGLPGESREDMLKTVRFIGNLALDKCESRQPERERFPERFPAGSPGAASNIFPLSGSQRSDGSPSRRTAHVDGIKLQLLHVLKGTELARMYETHPFPVMEPEEYFSLIADCIRLLPEDIVVHRISGDGPKRLLIAPQWSADKRFVLNSIARTLKETGAFQGQWAGQV